MVGQLVGKTLFFVTLHTLPYSCEDANCIYQGSTFPILTYLGARMSVSSYDLKKPACILGVGTGVVGATGRKKGWLHWLYPYYYSASLAVTSRSLPVYLGVVQELLRQQKALKEGGCLH